MAEREASEELPEDVSAYFKYKKEQVEAWMIILSYNVTLIPWKKTKLLAEYYLSTEDGLDRSDVEDMVEDFSL